METSPMNGPGHPTAGSLFREAWAAFWARRLASFSVGLVIALVCLIALATTGRTAATEREVLESVDSLGTRLITIIDSTGTAGIDPSVVGSAVHLEGVEWAFALGPAGNATLPGLAATRTGQPVVVREILGELPADLVFIAGREPAPGEAVAGTEAAAGLGLAQNAGTAQVEGHPRAVVGTIDASGPLRALADVVLLRPQDEAGVTVRFVYLRVASGYDVAAVAEAVQAIVPAQTPGGVEIEVAQGALDLRAVLSGTLGESSRHLMVITLGIGLGLVALTTTAAVNARRRDFGRQRAIGATRSSIVALVLLQSAIAGVLGSVIGIGIGLAFIAATFGQLPSLAFVTGLATLTIAVAIAGAAPPAIAAARRDPVRILRVP